MKLFKLAPIGVVRARLREVAQERDALRRELAIVMEARDGALSALADVRLQLAYAIKECDRWRGLAAQIPGLFRKWDEP